MNFQNSSENAMCTLRLSRNVILSLKISKLKIISVVNEHFSDEKFSKIFVSSMIEFKTGYFSLLVHG